MNPRWFFTSPPIEEYLKLIVRRKWDTTEIGLQVEAFAIASCDVMSTSYLVPFLQSLIYHIYTEMFKNARNKCTYVKAQIQDKIERSLGTYYCSNGTQMALVNLVFLAQITGESGVQMQWIYYDRDIVQQYSIKLISWTSKKFASPSTLGSNLTELIALKEEVEKEKAEEEKRIEVEKRKQRAGKRIKREYAVLGASDKPADFISSTVQGGPRLFEGHSFCTPTRNYSLL